MKPETLIGLLKDIIGRRFEQLDIATQSKLLFKILINFFHIAFIIFNEIVPGYDLQDETI